MNDRGSSPSVGDTILGGLAILFWTAGVAFMRNLTETLGVYRACFGMFLGAGVFLLIITIVRNRGLGWLRGFSARYLLGCGILFVVNTSCVYVSIGLAKSREAVLTAAMINFLWPALVLLFSVPILGNRARWTLWPGMLMAVAGIALVNATAGGLSWAGFVGLLRTNALSFSVALCAAVSWALYSNVNRLWGKEHDGDGVPLFLLATALVLYCTRLIEPWPAPEWTVVGGLELAYMALLPGALAYMFWDRAVRRGHFIFVGVMSYTVPLLSTAFTAIVLKIDTGIGLWVGCLILIAGAVVCKFSLRPALVSSVAAHDIPETPARLPG